MSLFDCVGQPVLEQDKRATVPEDGSDSLPATRGNEEIYPKIPFCGENRIKTSHDDLVRRLRTGTDDATNGRRALGR